MRANIHDVKTHLSRYLDELSEGEVLTICKRNEPIAELRKLGERGRGLRPVGLDRGRFVLDDRFFDPLPDELLRAFSGESE